MLGFQVDPRLCVRCGLCVKDCVAGIIQQPPRGFPAIAPEEEADCIGCEHCLAVCPAGALSILGDGPADVAGVDPAAWPTADAMEALLRGRRSMRQFDPGRVDADVITRLLDVAAYAPTGVNHRAVRLTVVESPEALAAFREAVFAAIDVAAKEGRLTDRFAWMADTPARFREHGDDILFRGAPHFVVATNPKDAPCVLADSFIVLAQFELMAQSMGLGTTWCGLLYWALELLPGLKAKLRLPEDHALGYALLFGRPAVRYPRSVRRAAEHVERLVRL